MLENILWNFAGQTGNFAVTRRNLAEDRVPIAHFQGAGIKKSRNLDAKGWSAPF
jgi:hypothetical protein